jgi:hypothetical protein
VSCAILDLLAGHIVITSCSQVGYKFPYCSLWSKYVPPSCRLLDNLKMPARSSGFHICDILDLNDAAAEGKPSTGGEGVSEAPHHLHHSGTYCCYKQQYWTADKGLSSTLRAGRKVNKSCVGDTSSFHVDEYEDDCLLGCCTV